MTVQPKDPYRIRDHVAAFDEHVARFRARSAETRARLRFATAPYGTGPGETLDIFFPSDTTGPAPVHIFLHGGYWRAFSKDDFSYVADAVTDAGAIAVIVDYDLMPRVRMDTLVRQVRAAAAWVAGNIASRGGDPSAVTVSGHSAGAHLACWLFDGPTATSPYGIKAALLLGGLYDLAPLRHSFLQEEVHLTEEEVRSWTPLDHRFAPAVSCTILVGERETPPFHEHAARFHRHLTTQGVPAELGTVANTDHMSSVLDLGTPGTEAGLALARLVAAGKVG